MTDRFLLDEHAFVARVADLVGFTEPQEAHGAIRATLSALGEQLPPHERSALSEALPTSFRSALGVGGARAMDLAEFFGAVCRREGVSLGFAREHAQVVCRALGERLPRDLRAEVERALQESVAELFRDPGAGGAPPGYHAAPGERHHTLATGRPGSRHPLSESKPEAAHRHSPAREDNPHADTKLSTASGMTQEREDESLATAQPDTRRRIGEASD